jgi:hypothetical protein
VYYTVNTVSDDWYLQIVPSERSFYLTLKDKLVVIRYWGDK